MGELCRRGKESAVAFPQIDREKILKETANLEIMKTSQDTDIPKKVIKDNSDIFLDFLLSSSNCLATKSIFPSILKQANITPVFKKGDRNLNSLHSKTDLLMLALIKVII